MKFLVFVGLLVAAMARPADACGVGVFAAPHAAEDLPPPPPPPPPDRLIGTKIAGSFLVLSVMTRWIVAMPRKVIA